MRILIALALLTVFPAAAARAQFAVTGVTPANNARGVATAAVVTLSFNAPVDPLTVTAQNIKLAGRWSGPVPGQLSVGPGGTTVTFAPLRPLFAAEIATLMVSHAVVSATAQPLTGGFTAMWWTATAPSSGTYVLDYVVNYRRPGEGAVRTYGFFAGDIDRDGAPDMSSTNEDSFDVRLMKNNGCGTFGPMTVTPLPSGGEPSPNEGADFNGDGWLDLATGNQTDQSVAVFLNSGTGSYLAPVVIPVLGDVHGLAVLDADSDGDVDIVATNTANLVLIRNNGNGTFQAPTFFNGGGSGEWSVAVGDANGDGRPDIFCGTSTTQAVTVLLGDGNGAFTPSVTRACGGFPWQMALGDLNGDGRLDCCVAEASNGRASVMFGNGAGGLATFVGYPVGSNPVSVDIGDIEGDGDLDIVVASFSNANATVLRNNGAGVFGGASTLAATIAGSCAVLVDYDRDGDMDVILVDELDDKGFVYRQVGPSASGVQSPSCAAALRVDSLANRGGYAGAPAHPLSGGARAFFGVSGDASQFFWLCAGTRLQPGVPLPYGLVNLDLGQPLGVFASGLLDAFGESTTTVLVPVGFPPGSTMAFQAAVTAPPSLVLSNPEVVVF